MLFRIFSLQLREIFRDEEFVDGVVSRGRPGLRGIVDELFAVLLKRFF